MRIRITPEQLEDTAQQFDKAINQLNAINSSLNSHYNQLRRRLVALTFKEYDLEYTKNSLEREKKMADLKKISNQLKNIAKMFRHVDTEILGDGPSTIKELKATDKELWMLSQTSYISDLCNDYNKNLNAAKNCDESDSSIIALKLGQPDSNWSVIATSSHNTTGYQGTAFQNKKTGEVIISHRGTESFQDIVTDAYQVVAGIELGQVTDAEKFTNTIQSTIGKDVKMVHTGHSLGGFLAQKMAMDHDQVAVTYNAPGFELTQNSHDLYNKDYSNQIRGYTINGDPVSNLTKFKPHGATYELSLHPNGSAFVNQLEKHAVNLTTGVANHIEENTPNFAKRILNEIEEHTPDSTKAFVNQVEENTLSNAKGFANHIADNTLNFSNHKLVSFETFFDKGDNIKPR